MLPFSFYCFIIKDHFIITFYSTMCNQFVKKHILCHDVDFFIQHSSHKKTAPRGSHFFCSFFSSENYVLKVHVESENKLALFVYSMQTFTCKHNFLNVSQELLFVGKGLYIFIFLHYLFKYFHVNCLISTLQVFPNTLVTLHTDHTVS